MFHSRIKIGLITVVRAEHLGNDLLSGEGGEGERLDELLGGAGHDDLRLHATFLQQPEDLSCLVRRDTASNAECNLHSCLDERSGKANQGWWLGSGSRNKPLTPNHQHLAFKLLLRCRAT